MDALPEALASGMGLKIVPVLFNKGRRLCSLCRWMCHHFVLCCVVAVCKHVCMCKRGLLYRWYPHLRKGGPRLDWGTVGPGALGPRWGFR